jgi:hypothetical protein
VKEKLLTRFGPEGMIQLSEFFGKSLTYLTYANGATLICQGFGNLFWM